MDEDEIFKKYNKKVKDKVGDEYTLLKVITQYTKRTRLKLRHNCDKCNNNEFEMDQYNFLKENKPNRCPKCYELNRGNYKKTDKEKFKKQLKELVGDEYELVGEFIDNNTKTEIRHNCEDCCNYTWPIKPQYFLNGNRCPVCQGRIITEDVASKRIKEDTDGEYELISGSFTTTRNKMQVLHHKCNKTFPVRANNFLNLKTRCPHCHVSTGEDILEEYLINHNINYIKNKKFNTCLSPKNSLLKFDFYLYDLNILIEFDGEQHFENIFHKPEEEFEYRKLCDKIKDEWIYTNWDNRFIRIGYSNLNNLNDIMDKLLSDKITDDINDIYFYSDLIEIKTGIYLK